MVDVKSIFAIRMCEHLLGLVEDVKYSVLKAKYVLKIFRQR